MYGALQLSEALLQAAKLLTMYLNMRAVRRERGKGSAPRLVYFDKPPSQLSTGRIAFPHHPFPLAEPYALVTTLPPACRDRSCASGADRCAFTSAEIGAAMRQPCRGPVARRRSSTRTFCDYAVQAAGGAARI